MEERTVRDLGTGAAPLRPDVRPDSPRLGLGWSTIAQKVLLFATDLDLASREGPCQEERS
jgi:hypothetical protein